MRYLAILLVSLIMFTGCAGTGIKIQRAARVQHALVVQQKVVHNDEAAEVAGVIKALDAVPEEKRTQNDEVALRLAEDAQKGLGLPEPTDTVDVDSLLSTNVVVKKVAEADLAKKEAAQDIAITKVDSLKSQLAETDKQLAQIAISKYNAGGSWWSKILKWGLGIVGIGGVAALCVFFPGLIPVIVKLGSNAVQAVYNFVTSIFDAIFNHKK